jgi:hypothetical protein
LPVAGAWRRGIRVFSSASDAPRSRRPTDVVLLALAVLTVVVLTFPAPGPTSIDSLVTNLVQGLPGLFGWFWEIAYDLLIVWSLVLIALALFARGRNGLLFEELLAGVLAVGFALAAGWLAGTDWSESFKAVAASGSPPIWVPIRPNSPTLSRVGSSRSRRRHQRESAARLIIRMLNDAGRFEVATTLAATAALPLSQDGHEASAGSTLAD